MFWPNYVSLIIPRVVIYTTMVVWFPKWFAFCWKCTRLTYRYINTRVQGTRPTTFSQNPKWRTQPEMADFRKWKWITASLWTGEFQNVKHLPRLVIMQYLGPILARLEAVGKDKRQWLNAIFCKSRVFTAKVYWPVAICYVYVTYVTCLYQTKANPKGKDFNSAKRYCLTSHSVTDRVNSFNNYEFNIMNMNMMWLSIVLL